MENYGSYQPQQINARYAQNSYVNKKEEEKEKIQKVVACTIGTLVGVGLASLVGYGIINKISSKNSSVNKATEEIKQSAQKNIEKNEKVVEENIQKVIYRTLNNIKNNKELNKKDIKEELFCLTSLTKNKMLPKAHLANINKYMIFLTDLIKFSKDKETIEKEEYGKIKDIYNTVNGFSKSSEDILSTVIMQDKVNTKLQEYGLNLTKFNVSSTNKHTLVCDSSNYCEFNDSTIKDTTGLVLLVDNIYIDNVEDVKEVTKFYIKDNNKFYEATLKEIGEKLANVKSIKIGDILGITDITGFNKKDATIEKCKDNSSSSSSSSSSTIGWYIYGNFTTTTTGPDKKHVSIAELSKNPNKFKIVLEAFNDTKDFNSGAAGAAFANAVKDSITSDDLGKLLNHTDLKGKLVDTSGNPTDAGKILITKWVEDNKGKPEDIANVLKGIDNFDKDSVGAAFANAVLNSKITPDDLGKLLNHTDLKGKLVDTSGNPTDAGKILIDKWVTEHNSKPDEIANVLKGIDNFDKDSVGAAFANAVVAKLNAENLGKLLNNNSLKGILVDDTGELKEAGKIMFEAASTKIFIGDFKEIAEKLKVKNFKQESEPKAIKIESEKLNYKSKSYLIDYCTRKINAGETLNAFVKTLLFINAKNGTDGKNKIINNQELTIDNIKNMIDTTINNDWTEYESLDGIKLYVDLVKDDTVPYDDTKFVEENITPDDLGKLLNHTDLKGKLVDTSGNPTDAGKILITNWVEEHKGNADEIAKVLNEINDFGDKSVGAAFANAVMKNIELTDLVQLLQKDDLKNKLKDTTNGLGKILISDMIDNKKIANIASVISSMEEKNCKTGEIGEVFFQQFIEKMSNEVLTSLFNSKMYFSVTTTSKIFIAKWVETYAGNTDKIAEVLKGIKDFEDKSVGAAFLQEITAKLDASKLSELLQRNDLGCTFFGDKDTELTTVNKGNSQLSSNFVTVLLKQLAYRLPEKNVKKDTTLETTVTRLLDSSSTIKEVQLELKESNWFSKNKKQQETDPVVQIGELRYKCRLDGDILYVRKVDDGGDYKMNILPISTSTGTSGS